MSKHTSPYPVLAVDATASRLSSYGGATLLLRTAVVSGLVEGLTSGLSAWRAPTARHDPGKILLDLAVSIAVGGDCMADLDELRGDPAVFGLVASDPTVSRLVSALASDPERALAAIDTARAAARARVWQLAGPASPDQQITAENPLILDVDATVLIAHSEKENAAATFKGTFGFHPLCVFADYGQAGTGEPLAIGLRAGNAGSNTAADHKQVIAAALAQIPGELPYRVGRKVLVRIDGGGSTHETIEYLHKRHLAYSVGFGLTTELADLVDLVPRPSGTDTAAVKSGWAPAIDDDTGAPRDGAMLCELTDLAAPHLACWPAGMRLIVRAERPHPGAQLRFTDRHGRRLTAFVTNSKGSIQHLELRHRRRARCEDRIRGLKDTGLRNLPLHGFDQNRIWTALAMLAADLIAWTQLLALTDHPARRWEPKKLRHRLFRIAARISRHARRTRLHLAATAPEAALVLAGLARLNQLQRGSP